MTSRLRQMSGVRSLVAVVLACSLYHAASAQEGAIDFKALYEAAEYDKALSVLSTLDTVEAQQYKALCLLALGKQDEARAAVSALVTASPTFVPSSEEVPPRFVEIVTAARRSLLPAIARQLFGEGREQYAAKRHEDAIARFVLVLTLVSDPDFEDKTAADDLRTLAQGFIDLARAAAPPPAPAKSVEAPAPAARTAAETVNVAPKVTQAVVIEQRVPTVPPEIVGRIGPTLVVVVQIDAAGKVSSTSIKQSAHPLFDRLVQQAARGWRYTPATLNGAPVPSERVVTLQTR